MLEAYGLTDRGYRRPENQDVFDIRRIAGSVLAAVCDGMGGEAAGDVASDLACTKFMEFAAHALETSGEADALDIFQLAVNAANSKVYSYSRLDEKFYGMGTTLVGCYITGDRAFIINVGDSRAYRLSKTGIRQVTTDHSLVQELIDRGELTQEQKKHHPERNIITRAVGSSRYVRGEPFIVPAEEGDCFLLCSDGLSNTLEDEELRRIIENAKDVKTACETLIDEALKRKAKDNITAVVIRVKEWAADYG